MAIDWGNLIGIAVNAGTSLYDMYNKNQIANDLQSAATSQTVDPFGSQRPYYQQQLRQLYNDPSYLENLPGYKFAEAQGEKGINRQAGRTGHYLSGNRLYDMAKFNQGLAQQTYNPEADRLAKLSGAGIGPNSGAFANLYSGGAGMDAARGTQLSDLLNFDGASGGLDLGGIIDSVMGDDAAGADGAAKDGGGNIIDQITDALGFGDQNADVAAAGNQAAGLPEGELGLQEAGGPGGGLADITSDYQSYEGLDAAGALGTDATSRAQELSGLGPNADLGGADFANYYATGGGNQVTTPGTLAESYQGYKDMASQGTTAGMAGGAVGGMLGGYLGSQIPGLGTDTPLGGYLGGVAGTYAGAYGGAALGGASTAVGTGAAAGTSAAGGAAMAAAGPAAIAGALLMIGQGMYGMYKGAKQRDRNRDAYRRVVGEATHGGQQIADPTGKNLGMGTMYSSGGQNFFLPAKHYENLKRKNMQGEYGHHSEFADMQGLYGYWQNPNDNEWYGGSFMTSDQYGANALDWRAFQLQDLEAAQQKWGSQNTLYSANRGSKAGQWGTDLSAVTDAWQALDEAGGRIPEGEQGTLLGDYQTLQRQWSNTSRMEESGGIMPTEQQQAQIKQDFMTGNVRASHRQTHDNQDPVTWISNTQWEQQQANQDWAARSCFVGETLIAMADGSERPIESIKPGMLVAAQGGTNKVIGVERVALDDRYLYSVNGIGRKGWITDEHPIMTDKGWRTFNNEHTYKYHNTDIQVGTFEFFDRLHMLDGKLRLTSTEQYDAPGATAVYNLLLDGDHTYYAGPDAKHLFLVHNRD